MGGRGTPGVSATEAASEAANNVTEKAETPASASDPRWRLRICPALALRMGTEQNGQCHGLGRVTRQTRGMAQLGEVHMAWHSRAIIHLGRGRSHALVAIRLMRKPQAVEDALARAAKFTSSSSLRRHPQQGAHQLSEYCERACMKCGEHTCGGRRRLGRRGRTFRQGHCSSFRVLAFVSKSKPT